LIFDECVSIAHKIHQPSFAKLQLILKTQYLQDKKIIIMDALL